MSGPGCSSDPEAVSGKASSRSLREKCRCRNSSAEGQQAAQEPVQFSAEMIKDQELLVSTLSQQGVPEALIRRQFNRLLDEQSKQLAPSARGVEEPSLGKPRQLEPSSLPGLRLKKELLDSRSRNNGLQDLATAARIIDKSKAPAGRRPGVRLDGTQDRSASEAFCRAHALRQPPQQPARPARPLDSANGLSNSTSRPAAAALDTEAASSPAAAPAQPLAQLPDPQHRSPHDSAPDCPQIQEPRVFGGFTYFARKPQCVPQFACTPHQHHSHPRVKSARSTTAF